MPPPRTSCALAMAGVVLAGFLWLGDSQTSRAAPSRSNSARSRRATSAPS